ncbi:hypothetical protein QN277_023363 [Acacia crassicarpa]|uniref:Homeobox domain-containing protein n=1 Tax=Acacia crassicarpa TaxID=499986 RepID=A0AAE1JH44_9FABA|nr:hypothetical protein QN277_023363 [Acacia crassicarpa]
MSRAGSSRWSPTPEQLMILEQLYRSGIRTPSASQIQHITTHLCFYGRIEGKNVFYWFQNHKARDRQKLRRKLTKQLQLQQQQYQMLAHDQCQVINHQDNKTHHHHWSFGGFDSSPGSSSAQQVSFYNPPILLSQGEPSSETWKTAQRQQSEEMMDKTKTMTSSSLYYNNNGMMSSCCCWSSVEDVNEESSYCNTSRPLKTLDLFPTTSSKLKEGPFNPTP